MPRIGMLFSGTDSPSHDKKAEKSLFSKLQLYSKICKGSAEESDIICRHNVINARSYVQKSIRGHLCGTTLRSFTCFGNSSEARSRG